MAKKKTRPGEAYKEMHTRAQRLEALYNLSNSIREVERRIPIPFDDFLHIAAQDPERIFRDIFQLIYDMVDHYVVEHIDEHDQSENSIGFIGYDCTDLFVTGSDYPFFADRLFANRLMNLIRGFKKGTPHNRIFLFEGPPGSGKSTFLNNFLTRLEEYTHLPEGVMYNTIWRIDTQRLGTLQNLEKIARSAPDETFVKAGQQDQYIDYCCPYQDHPILQIPKPYRRDFLDALIPDEKFKEKLFNSTEYEWVLKDSPCGICTSVYTQLLDSIGDPLEVFGMLYARKAHYNRMFGEGISIFNPGDTPYHKPIVNLTQQNLINQAFKSDEIRYIYSYLANTDNGVYALMDIKDHNIERLKSLHTVISDGVHKVELIEERIKSFFVGLVNPEDKLHYEHIKSFQDRIITVNIPYILDYNTEVGIYFNKFGADIKSSFLPRVLKNFAKIIISSRLEKESATIKKWLVKPQVYAKTADKNFLLLKMNVYTGKIPDWLTEEDFKRFDKQMRKEMVDEAEKEGHKGFSGRQSLNIFNEFYTKFGNSDKLITMDMVVDFFVENKEAFGNEIPQDFINSLHDLYDFNVLQEVKEAIYYYNEEQISKDIQNYLYGINFEMGTTVKCLYTSDVLEISEDFFKTFETLILGAEVTDEQRKLFRKDEQKEYSSRTVAQEIRLKQRVITATDQYKMMFEKYIRNLKKNALVPYIDNENFRRAINEHGTSGYNTFDARLRRDINFLLSNLKKKFGYTEDGAKIIALYVLDKNLIKKYPA
ncbi:MAG: serine protein kinase PrkA [Bacteroidetes bacterium]|nr:serine protein kinase PrkA [Bacteroidota bacterium]MBU1720963.1 serine protein kinase PrkA [Bacteroidota bacterium]